MAALKRGYGWRRQPFDPRDLYYFTSNRAISRLAPTCDLTFGMGPELDQGAQGSCGPNTSDEVITFDQKAQGLDVVGASRHFIYWMTRYLMGTVNEDSGVDNRTMLKALATYGFPPESLDPYSDAMADMVKKPSQAAISAAASNIITDYQAIVQSLSQMKGAIATRGRPFIFGFDVCAKENEAPVNMTRMMISFFISLFCMVNIYVRFSLVMAAFSISSLS